MADIMAHGDRCHRRLKAAASGSERVQVERGDGKQSETVAAEQVNTNAAGGRRGGGGVGGQWSSFTLRSKSVEATAHQTANAFSTSPDIDALLF